MAWRILVTSASGMGQRRAIILPRIDDFCRIA
jgi:hypothetical protein